MKVLVGMSGGIDSAVTAWYLQKAGLRVSGCHISLKEHDADERDRTQRICSLLEIPCRYISRKEAMERRIVASMVQDYEAGQTPNPCIHCNARIKFPSLLEIMAEEKAQKTATGHYVQKRGFCEGFVLGCGVDSSKDQSYMLSQIPRVLLKDLLFPLGRFWKKTIYAMASEVFGDMFSHIPESQDICFLENRNLQEYLQENLSAESRQKGPIVSHQGERLGEHEGLFRYTIGQRKGLGLSGGPWFVYDMNTQSNTLFVGPLDKLSTNHVLCHSLNWFIPPEKLKKTELWAKVRYKSLPVKIAHFSVDQQTLSIETSFPLQSVAPGQALVLYAKNLMVCGAIIGKTERR